MMTHPHEERLQDYIDDLLCREERAELEAHLASCSECTSEVRRARELQRAFEELPRELAPPAHLKVAINACIDAQPLREEGDVAAPRAVQPSIFDRPLRTFRPLLAAAALVLVFATAAVTALLMRQEAPPRIAGPGTDAPAVLAVERPYQRAAEELNATLVAGEDLLAPETLRILEENLRVIDAALAEARAALREDPGNGAVLEVLRATHERRLDLLRQVTRHSRGT